MTELAGEPERRIVVGVDGSASSKAALAWAISQATLTGETVEAVIAWEFPVGYSFAFAASAAGVDFQGIAVQVVADAVAELASLAGPVTIRSIAVEGNPTRVLLDASAGAELLVVGGRGHEGFTEALLGSVSQHCVHHATCPVMVIRDSLPHPGKALPEAG
jgi:nucleotide-binding universal stress UspA family protein